MIHIKKKKKNKKKTEQTKCKMEPHFKKRNDLISIGDMYFMDKLCYISKPVTGPHAKTFSSSMHVSIVWQ